MGNVWIGRKPCGKPAKFHKATGLGGVGLVCGIHERTLRLRGWGTAEPLAYKEAPHSGHSDRSTGTIASAESPPAESPATRGQV
jgi:hypothetical protein